MKSDLTIAYTRVSSRDQKDDLKRQVQRLEMHCAAKGWTYEVIQDPRFGDELPEEGPEATDGNKPESSGQEGGISA